MSEHILTGIALIVILGIGAQWLAWRLGIPAILLLLLSGYLAGPLTGFINPSQLFGDLLSPVVSLGIAIILYEAGLSLKFSEIRKVRGIVLSLITIGLLTTWILTSAAAYWILRIEPAIAILLGSILVVTGPTVIVPLLRHIRPLGDVGSVIKWEGIINDPIGAILAVIVFRAIIASGVEDAVISVILGVVKSVVIGSAIGFLSAGIIILVLKRYWVPDFLQNPFSLMTVIGAFTLSDYIQSESGLLSATLMGIVLANQKLVNVKHIVEFKENLRVLLISVVFIILASRFSIGQLNDFLNLNSLFFLGALVFIVRPFSVILATIFRGIKRREMLFLSWMAPRGIVAAGVSSIFALRLEQSGHPSASIMVTETFFIITGSVLIYGLTASPLAHWLRLSDRNPQGLLLVGANKLARSIAKILHGEGIRVMLVDSDWYNVSVAKKAGLPTRLGSILSDDISDVIDLSGIGRLLALTPNDEVNSLAVLHFAEIFDRSELYQLPTSKYKHEDDEGIPLHLRGRLLFGPDVTYSYLMEKLDSGSVIKKSHLTDKFDYNHFVTHYGQSAIPLLMITDGKELTVVATDNPLSPQPGQILISLVDPENKQ